MTNAVEKFIAENDLNDWTIIGEYNQGKLVRMPAREIVDQYRSDCTDSHTVVAEYGDAQVFNALSELINSPIGADASSIIEDALDKLTELAHDAACEALDAKVYDGDLQEFGPLTEDRIVQAGTDFEEIGVWVAKNGGYTWCKLADTADYMEDAE